MRFIKKGTKPYSILNNKCPRCHEGKFFENDSPFTYKRMMKMHETCPSCKFKYEIEPSFFYGAMYVSYGLTVGMSIISFIVLYFLGFNMLYSIIGSIIILILFMPITYRFARLIYANMFIKYEKDL